MTNKLVVIINSLKVPTIKKILLYELKFLVPNYSCLQNPWLGGYCHQIPVLSVLNWICWTPQRTKFLGMPLDPGGVRFINSCLTHFLGNTSNGGMKCPVGLIQLTTVTRDPRSADWTEDIWRLLSVIYSCGCAVQYYCHFVAILNSCRIMLNVVNSGFIDLKKYWATDAGWNISLLRVKTFSAFDWNFLTTMWEIFQPLPCRLQPATRTLLQPNRT